MEPVFFSVLGDVGLFGPPESELLCCDAELGDHDCPPHSTSQRGKHGNKSRQVIVIEITHCMVLLAAFLRRIAKAAVHF